MDDRAAERYAPGAPDSLVRGDEVRCCVRDCDQWLPRRRRGVAEYGYCPRHHISVSASSQSPTYVYEDATSNFIVDRSTPARLSKVESWRLGNERSEDALSWNLFVSLARLGLLRAAFPEFGVGTEPPELYLWGNRVSGGPPGVWHRLKETRDRLERGARFSTEPDVMLRVPGKVLILIEAKFGSTNGTFLRKKNPRESVEKLLARYEPVPGANDPLDRASIRSLEPGAVLEQLCRNVMVGSWLAERGERTILVNLVKDDAERDVEDRFRGHLSRNGSVEFIRRTWESFWPAVVGLGEAAGPLRRYLENKTISLRRAFPSLPLSVDHQPNREGRRLGG